ncbi:MAG: hypothetical protein WCG83_01855 [Candidatus Peregrinibacteria bacterium]
MSENLGEGPANEATPATSPPTEAPPAYSYGKVLQECDLILSASDDDMNVARGVVTSSGFFAKYPEPERIPLVREILRRGILGGEFYDLLGLCHNDLARMQDTLAPAESEFPTRDNLMLLIEVAHRRREKGELTPAKADEIQQAAMHMLCIL